MHRFLVVFKKAEGNYSAYSPDLPGCIATGATCEDAERNMHEAIEMHVRDRWKTICRFLRPCLLQNMLL